jgi:succinate dehydrogenase/fumarate reductase cytochrome b subunit
MAGNSQMNDNERGIFSLLHGITGMLIATVLLLTILGVLTYNAIIVQQNEATNFYKINQELDGLKFTSPDNHKQYELVGKPQ